ncbi:hypothetical protein ASG90_15820 [Nocardioides sp. Soil797]|nr:hypothetical protein ASG90_15820 [Nocardioides sp. Soil797]
MRRFGVLFASAILMLSVSACGDDDSKDDSKAGDPASPTSSETVETPTESPTEVETPTDTPTDVETSTDPSTSSGDPTKDAFCARATSEGFTTGGFKEIKGWAKQMKGITTPDDMSADEKEGMEILIKTINGATSEAELNKAGNSVSKADQAKLSAFIAYVSTDCA